MIPETQRENQDLTDLFTTASQEVKEVPDEQGIDQRVLELNPDILYYKLQNVSSNRFGRMALLVKLVEKKADEAIYNMSRERALVYKKQIIAIVEAYKRSIDAKSSESVLDKNNKMQTLIDKVKGNKQEKIYTVKDEAKNRGVLGFVGSKEEREA